MRSLRFLNQVFFLNNRCLFPFLFLSGHLCRHYARHRAGTGQYSILQLFPVHMDRPAFRNAGSCRLPAPVGISPAGQRKPPPTMRAEKGRLRFPSCRDNFLLMRERLCICCIKQFLCHKGFMCPLNNDPFRPVIFNLTLRADFLLPCFPPDSLSKINLFFQHVANGCNGPQLFFFFL